MTTNIKSTKRVTGIPVSSRIAPELRERLLNKHPKEGEISKLIRSLLQRYIDGKIIGVRLME